MTPSEAASITAIARELRAEIYSGKYPVGSQLPTRVKLAKDKRVSAESAGTVMRMLAGEGLISLEQGRGTFVLPRYWFFAGVSVPRGAVPKSADERRRLAAALKAVEATEPAVSGVDALADAVRARVAMNVECADAARAVVIALTVTRSAARADRWSWEGWDFDGASVEAHPAGGDRD